MNTNPLSALTGVHPQPKLMSRTYKMPGLRADRLATLYLFHPLCRLLRSGRAGIPILMYHSISGIDESAKHPYYRIATASRVFEEQLKLLYHKDYKAVSPSDAVRLAQEPGRNAEKLVVITFDDGYQDFYTHAFPILSQYGFTATVFLPTAYIGDTTRGLNGAACLTWSQVRELRGAGVDFGSHTITHRQLNTLNIEDVRYELRYSKETIEEKLGYPVKSFAYPYAFPETDRDFTQRLREILDQTGYENGVSTIIGIAHPSNDRFFMKRLPVNSCDDLPFFRAKLEGAYDWLHAFQYASKLTGKTQSTLSS